MHAHALLLHCTVFYCAAYATIVRFLPQQRNSNSSVAQFVALLVLLNRLKK
jgi:hypothetical protein